MLFSSFIDVTVGQKRAEVRILQFTFWAHSDKGLLINITLGLQWLSQHDPYSCSVIQLTFHFVNKGIIRGFIRCIAKTELLYLHEFLFIIKTIIIDTF